MIRFITKFVTMGLRFILAVFLLLFFIIKMYYLINNKVHETIDVDIYGYTYIKVNDDNLSPDIKTGDYIILKRDDNIKINDYVAYIENNSLSLNKVSNINEDEVTLSNSNIISKNDVKFKYIYKNETLNKVLKIMTHPIVVIVMILYIIFIPQLIYKRYE